MAWQYEPKWDGFRCLAFKDGKNVELQSKNGQSVGRYFPELIFALKEIKTKKFVLDGEIVIPVQGSFSFDALLQRIHPAESRVQNLSQEYPANLIVFDLLIFADWKLLGSRSKNAAGPYKSFLRSAWHKIQPFNFHQSPIKLT
jgi:ATP-dependent DNA ligase